MIVYRLLTKLMEYVPNFTIYIIKFFISEINSTDNGIYQKPPKNPKGTIHTPICHTANIRSRGESDDVFKFTYFFVISENKKKTGDDNR